MTRHRPTLAVVIPAYNAAERIGDALRSLQAQTEPPDEIIVCDDGSQDDLRGALASFRDDLTVVRQPNKGPSAARNTGAARVRTSEWILFLDSDDWLEEEVLESLRERVVSDPELDLLAIDAVGIDASDGRRLYRYYDLMTFPNTIESQRLAIVQENFLLTGVTVRRRRFEDVGGFDESVARCEDYELWMRLILSGSRVGLVRGPLLYRRHHGDNLSAQRRTMLGWRVDVIDRGLHRDDLTDLERAAAERSLRQNTRLLRRQEVQELIAQLGNDEPPPTDRHDLRRTAGRLLCRTGPRVRQRLLLAAAILSPEATGRLVARRRAGS